MTAALRFRHVAAAVLLAVLAGWMLDADWGPNMCDHAVTAVVR